MNQYYCRTILFLLLTCIVTSACGFNLRGRGRESGSEIVGKVYIEEVGPVTVGVQLRNALKAEQVQFTPYINEADTRVVLSNEVLSRRVASVSASGRVSEYELLHAIDLLTYRSNRLTASTPVAESSVAPSVTDASRTPQTVSVIRDYTYDETDVLAKDDEERILRAEMAGELVRHLILRIFAGVL